MMKRLFVILCLISFGIACDPLAAQTQPAPKPATHASSTTTQSRTGHMTTDPALLHPATLNAKAPDTFQVQFGTTKGDFVVEVTRAWAPLGADRFYNLVKHGYFTDAAFFRVVPGFIIQFGLSADPNVTKVWRNANIKDDRVTQSNSPGTITFATAGPNTRTTQLFINLRNNAALDGQGFAPFGRVISGMDVVQKLYSGYGELRDLGGNGPSSERIGQDGKAYLDKNFPMLDSIKSATIISPAAAPSAEVHKSAPAAAGTPPNP